MKSGMSEGIFCGLRCMMIPWRTSGQQAGCASATHSTEGKAVQFSLHATLGVCPVAQLVEHSPVKRVVAGSRPAWTVELLWCKGQHP